MKFLVDECTGKRLSELLRKDGHDVLFAGDIMPSATDEEIIRKCEKDNRILITDDKDFGELVFRLNRPVKGVILLRISTIPEKRLKAVQRLLREHEVQNKFIVIEEEIIRVRKISSGS